MAEDPNEKVYASDCECKQIAFYKPGDSKPYEQNPEFEKIPDIDSNRDNYDIISFEMNPGDLLAFHSLVVHGSNGNFSKIHRRRGYAVRYTGDNVFYVECHVFL